MKKLALFAFIILLLTTLISCQSLEEKRWDSIHSFLANETDLTEIKIVDLDNKAPLSKIAQEPLMVEQSLIVLQNIDNTQKAINCFKKTVLDNSKIIWLKTMTTTQKDAYQKVIEQHDKALHSYWNIISEYDKNSYKWDSQINATETDNIGSLSNHLIIEYKKNTGEKMIGVFYFNNTQSNIAAAYQFTQEQVKWISNLYINRKKYNTSFIPNLENEGFDIIQEEEDPTKTKEERTKIKSREIAEKEKRKNEELDTQIKNDIHAYINAMNANGSVQVDDITIFQKAAYNSSTISIYYRLNARKSDYSSYQWEAMGDFKKTDIREQCKDVLKYFIGNVTVSRYEVEEAFERIGLKWKYIYKDLHGNTLFTIEITADELS